MKKLLFCFSAILCAEETLSIMQEPIPQNVMELPPPKFEPGQKNAAIAVPLAIIPGLGHAYLGDWETAGSLFGSTVTFLGVGLAGIENRNITTPMNYGLDTDVCYSIYAAYRDTRYHNGISNYSYRMPMDSFADLAFASFNPSVLKKPEVWGGFLGSMAIAMGIGYLEHVASKTLSHGPKNSFFPPYAFTVGIREEALFRGYLQSQIAEYTNPATGIILSSLLFGAAHIPNATSEKLGIDDPKRYYLYTLPFITAYGAYFGWMANKNHSLKECVALHSWYDFTLFALHYFGKEAYIPRGPAGFSMSFSF
jgi:membrane protease YdiL (CAAX protease family)